MKWTVGTAYVGVLMVAVVGVSFILTIASSPDDLVAGTWQEVSWEYEKVDKSRSSESLSGKEISENVKQLISQDLIVHRAEKWEFTPGGRLLLNKNDTSTTSAHWKLKGRGHILIVHYPNRLEESYNIVQLDNHQMVLHFYTEMQARGIAKITFTRVP